MINKCSRAHHHQNPDCTGVHLRWFIPSSTSLPSTFWTYLINGFSLPASEIVPISNFVHDAQLTFGTNRATCLLATSNNSLCGLYGRLLTESDADMLALSLARLLSRNHYYIVLVALVALVLHCTVSHCNHHQKVNLDPFITDSCHPHNIANYRTLSSLSLVHAFLSLSHRIAPLRAFCSCT